MSVSAFNLIFVSFFLVLSVQANQCSEAFHVADVAVNRLKLNFMEKTYDSLPYDLLNLYRVTDAIHHVCPGISILTPAAKNSSYLSCEATQFVLTELLSEYSYGNSTDLEKQALIIYLIEQSLTLEADIENGKCLYKWIKEAYSAATMQDDEPEESIQAQIKRMNEWWTDSQSYINLHIGEMIDDLFGRIGLDV